MPVSLQEYSDVEAEVTWLSIVNTGWPAVYSR